MLSPMLQRLSLVTLGVADVGRAQAAGATIDRAGSATFWGGHSGIFIDPDGHPWEIAHNSGWVLSEDGTVRLH